VTYTAKDRIRVKDAQYRRTYILRRHHGIPTSLVPADRARAHLAALLELGWSAKALAAMSNGVTGTTLNNLQHGTHQTIERATATAVLSIPHTLAPNTNVPDKSLIPTLGAERRVQALMALGWTHDSMRAHAANTTHLARSTYKQMLASRWRAVDDMYQQLSMQPGPSPTTAKRANAAGWVTPLAWDNIDNPNETPNVGGHDDDIDPVVVARLLAGHNVPATRAERTEVIRRWVADGRPARELNGRYGWKIERYWKHGEAA
jgi:hypothetical protein